MCGIILSCTVYMLVEDYESVRGESRSKDAFHIITAVHE